MIYPFRKSQMENEFNQLESYQVLKEVMKKIKNSYYLKK